LLALVVGRHGEHITLRNTPDEGRRTPAGR
jgi:hypothetical protein